MANQNDPELRNILRQWGKEAPLADYYKCSFIYYFAQGVISEDNTNLNFSEDLPWIKEGKFYRYPKLTVNEPVLKKGLEYLFQGIDKYKNRFDLWQQLVEVLAAFYYHEDLTDVLIAFMDTVQQMENENVGWFVRLNQPISALPNYTNNDTLFYRFIRINADPIVGKYKFKNAFPNYERIYRKFIELYPNDSGAYNELGYSLVDPNESLKYYEKAYELDNTNKNAILNAAITADYLKIKDKTDKYSKLLYATGDKELISVYEQNKN